jgi:outer membrane receptor for ferrienterochelin and colicin
MRIDYSRDVPGPARIYISVSTLVLVVITGTAMRAQLQQTTITAIVLDAAQRPVSGAAVVLTDPLGAELHRLETDTSGRAVFTRITPGRYELLTTTGTAPRIQLPVNVSAAVPMEITIRVPTALADRVEVEGLTDETTTRGTLVGTSIARVPTRARSRALQDVIATLPGWATEDNGLLHARGVDDGYLYVIDGVPVYERLDSLSGLAPDVHAIASINVITGYVAPEFGYKAGGVIDVRSATADRWLANTDVELGSDDGRDVSATLGGGVSDSIGVRIGGSAMASDRYLDPVHPDNLHNSGGQANASGQFDWAWSVADRLSVGWGIGAARFDVPHNHEQEASGQDQRQRIGQASVNGTWQRTWSADVVTQTAFYHRNTSAELESSVGDTPLAASADRRLERTGVLVAATKQHGAHVLKGGFEFQRLTLDEQFRFAVTDPDEAREAEFREEALAFTRDNPFAFDGTAVPTLAAAYVQDTWHAMPRVTLSGGVRFDRSQLLLTRTQLSPRAGVAMRVSDEMVLRLAASRYFQPPQPEHLLLSSSPQARVLSSIVVEGVQGGADIEPERQWGTELSAQRRFGRAHLDLTYWRRWMRNVADPNVFAGTTIIFPNAVAKGRAQGFEMRVEVPRARGWSGYANWSIAKVVQTGPINGGLFLEDEVEEIGRGVEFAPDHDQRYSAGGGMSWEHPRTRLAVSVVARYESGTPVPVEDDELDEWLDLPGVELVDLDAGRVKPRTVVSLLATAPVLSTAAMHAFVGAHVLNLFDARYAYNFGNPFSGTHFGAPRTFAVSLRFEFR